MINCIEHVVFIGFFSRMKPYLGVLMYPSMRDTKGWANSVDLME